ncbi:MAG: hypothetical protein A2289_06650 [Deltaproteobacteria bacterium RIFOXYA12_FULL_58_15]|nr:MAG: hypothetical protein A2289_06650 [Deltaproteobacteria bacterium RIFOXYA12_FULL_58_15]OGR10808.1 MAG: hypothetical protein A2341_24855 [Deltaproteobacteria bacterium RIFOXYB12_FULL_58_9]
MKCALPKLASLLLVPAAIACANNDPAPACSDPSEELPRVALEDCDGNPRDIAELNEPAVSWLYLYAGWCGACQARAGLANELASEFAGSGFAAFFVITEDDQHAAPTTQYCAAVRDHFALSMPVLIDPQGALAPALSVPVNSVDVVTHCGEIILEKSDATDNEVRDAIETALEM